MADNDYFGSFSRLAKGTKARSDAVNAIFDQLNTGLDKLPNENEGNRGTRNYSVDTGVANTYAVTLAHISGSYADGQDVVMLTANANTGASTLNASGIGNTAIVLNNGDALPAGTIQANSLNHLKYNTTLSAWQLMGVFEITNSVTPFVATLLDDASSRKFLATLGIIVNPNASLNQRTVGIGSGVLASLSSGDLTVAVGYNALTALTSAVGNVAVGSEALTANTTGGQNVAVGLRSLGANIGGAVNTGIGDQALTDNISGSQNTSVGAFSGNSTTGSNNSCLGFSSASSSTSVSNEVTLGNSSITTLRCQVTTITALSDKRDKKNILDLDCGIDFINGMRPVSFDWNRRDGTYEGVSEVGFIAQDLKELEESHGIEDATRIVLNENPEKLEAAPMRTYPILIKAVQELSEKLDSAMKKIESLEARS